jgi:outer membrane protein TolC
VQVQVNLWNWGATLFQTEQAKAGLKQNQAQLEQLKENTMLEVERSLLVMQRAREKITVARIGVDQAEENARVTGEKHRSGLATTSDILDAEVALLQARTAFVGALVEFELAKAQLKRATGGNTD